MNIEKMVKVRKSRKISQRELSEKIGVHRTNIARYETGVNEPPIDYIIKFCEFFEVSADYILGLPKNMNYPEN